MNTFLTIVVLFYRSLLDDDWTLELAVYIAPSIIFPRRIAFSPKRLADRVSLIYGSISCVACFRISLSFHF